MKFCTNCGKKLHGQNCDCLNKDKKDNFTLIIDIFKDYFTNQKSCLYKYTNIYDKRIIYIMIVIHIVITALYETFSFYYILQYNFHRLYFDDMNRLYKIFDYTKITVTNHINIFNKVLLMELGIIFILYVILNVIYKDKQNVNKFFIVFSINFIFIDISLIISYFLLKFVTDYFIISLISICFIFISIIYSLIMNLLFFNKFLKHKNNYLIYTIIFGLFYFVYLNYCLKII